MAKRILDIFGSLMGIFVFLPIIPIIAIAIKLTSHGPILYSQRRLGKDGKEFSMLKFRSMVDGAEHQGTGLFSYDNDTRVTRIGALLRATSLDEIPQLFNVLGGSMSLVGPRPPVYYELGNYEDFTGDLKRRFQIKPGIVGLAQVSGRNNLSWDQKIGYDVLYMERFKNFGILEDIRIIMLSIFVILSMKNVNELEK